MKWTRFPVHRLALLLVFGSLGSAWAQSETAPRTAAVIAGIEGTVRIERAGVSSALEARLGDRLRTGDVVRAGGDSAVTIFFSGGHIVRVPAGSRLEIVMDPGSPPPGSRVARMSDRLLTVVEEGLWVLSDPRGDILLGAMRGDARVASPPHLLLSPRRETLTGTQPTFFWTSAEMQVRVVIETDGSVVWQSDAVSGSTLAYPAQAPALRPGGTYRWWIETTSHDRLASPERFDVPTAELIADFAAFESELETLVSTGGIGPVKTLLRCAFYHGTSAWSPLLETSLELRDPGYDSHDSFAARTTALARRKMGLTEAEARQFVDVRSE